MTEGLDPDVGPSPLEDQPANKEVNIVLAGKAGAGKSTLFYNLIGEKKKIKLSAKPVTKDKDSKRIVRGDVAINLIDTRGFIVSKMSVQDVEEKFDLLIYCIPVSPGTKFDDFNPELMKKLNSIYGKDVWKHCVIVFTFSNQALGIACDDQKEEEGIKIYKDYITEYATEFQKELEHTLKVKDAKVQTFFTQDIGGPQDANVIPAIPAGFKLDDKVFPDKFPDEQLTDKEKCKGWTDKVFIEMVKKCRGDEKMFELATFKYGHERAKQIIKKVGKTITGSGVSGVVLGTMGGVVGAFAGSPGGPPGIIVGAVAGASAGLLAGATVGGTIAFHTKQ